MAIKKYHIRLYKIHDLDLITFIEERQFILCKAVYACLKAFCNGKVFVISQPPKQTSGRGYKRVYQQILKLDTETDQDEIQLLDAIAPGYRNNFLKNLLRLYLACPATELFFRQDPGPWMDKFEVFRDGRRQAAVGRPSLMLFRARNGSRRETARNPDRAYGEDQAGFPVTDLVTENQGDEKKQNASVDKSTILKKRQPADNLPDTQDKQTPAPKEVMKDDVMIPPPDMSPAAEQETLGDDQELTDIFAGLL